MSDDTTLRECDCGAIYQVEESERVSPTSPRERVRYECPNCGRQLRATDLTKRVIAHERAAQ